MPGSSARECRNRVRLRRRVSVGVLMLGLAVVADSDQSATTARQYVRGRVAGATSVASAAATWTGALAVTPAPNAADVPVTAPVVVVVTVAASILDTVTLTDTEGRQVTGDFDPGRRGWHATAPLGYNRRYTVTVTAIDLGGRQLTRSSPFTTIKPANLTRPYLQANGGLLLSDRQTYGVGQPIVIRFDEKIPDRTAAQKALEVVTEPHVDGAWHWFSDHELHWRPPEYWVPGTRVSIKANLYGKDLGRGLYGQNDASASFTIGPSKIAIADDNTHHILVSIDGQQVRDVPTAMGKHESTTGAHGETVDFRTRSGVHVVLGNQRVTRMTSASFGITSGPNAYDEKIEWTTHLSYAGEYLHAAPWSVAQQGHRDASHGCLNVSTENAIWLYNNFGPGDIVEVRNTGIALGPTDGLGDWTLSWEDWLAGSALPSSPPASSRPVNLSRPAS
ncbi:MAG: L,D-transpeptidase catalytic protein [Dactylosporangium sp.]|nr:L,D-transpeptidase catalytic protein [Dactylosporangium sp.]